MSRAVVMNAAQQGEPSSHRIELRTRRDTTRLGALLGRALQAGDLVMLEGDLGAGKTFLARAVARTLGVPSSIPVTSPTFELVHELPGRIPILHADLYRLASSESIEELGILQRVGRDAIALVEWGDRFAAELGGDGLWVQLDLGASAGRTCTLSARGPRGRALLERLFPHLSRFSSPTG